MKRWLRPLGLACALGLLLWALLVALSPRKDEARASGGSRDEVVAHAGEVGAGGIGARSAEDTAAAVVEAQIVDEDGMPVSEGVVELSCLWDDEVKRIEGGIVRPGEDGWFSAPGCRGTVCAAFSHPHLVPSDPWVLRPGVAAQLSARSLLRLWGQVLDGSGSPVPAARITFVQPPDDPDPTAVLPLMSRSTGTDEDGLFTVALIERPPCGPCEEALGRCDERPMPVLDRFVATVRADGHGPLDHEVTLEMAQRSSADGPITMVLPESRDILSGVLLDPEGRPYPRAYVLARSESRPHEQHRGELSGETFEIEGLGEGPYALRAIQDGVELARSSAVMPGDDVVLRGDRPAEGPDVVLQIRRDGLPAAGVFVDGGPFRGARTDMEGQVRAAQVLPGQLLLRLRPPGRPHVIREIDVPTEASANPLEIHVDLDAGS